MKRLRDYKGDILRFVADWTVPFTNNEAEQTIRFSKVKHKISGGFRTKEGSEDYMQIMSFVSTARKHGMSYFEAVQTALAGNALPLAEQRGNIFSRIGWKRKVIHSSKMGTRVG